MNQKRKFTPEFNKEAVVLVTEQDYTVAKAAASHMAPLPGAGH